MAEMVAILESLRFLMSKPYTSCVIFSDSLSAIEAIESGSYMSPIHQNIKYYLHHLWRQGVQVVLCWIPSHVGIRGNEVADGLAKEALLRQAIDYSVLLDITDLYGILEKHLLNVWQSLWDSEKKGRFYYNIQPEVSFDVKYYDICKAKQTCITRLRFGKCMLGDILHMIGKRGNNQCEHCHVKEDVAHFLLDCSLFEEFQVERNNCLLEKGIIPSVETLLGNAESFDNVWKYVLNTQKSL